MTKPVRKRCAIYTRKSTDEGLEQDFNSLDAQREACSAYILSQAGEGWEQIDEHYDDGGWSGGSMERPAINQLMDDVQAGRVDIIIVYKVDRLTRSLADFAKIVEILDEKDASFVSVTQAFNTTTSMGRLTLNVLLSFAQFEREVTGERIRDKIAASKRKGMWMGGTVPHGYYVHERKLLVNDKEAKEVRYIFNRYLELGSTMKLVDELAVKGIRTRQRNLTCGRKIGNVHFGRGPLGHLLKNQVYIGKTKHKDAVYDGEHEAIIDLETFDKVQALIAANNNDKRTSKNAKLPSLLAGLIFDPDRRPMSPMRGQKGDRQYCYYVTRFKPGEDKSTIYRLPAGEVDGLVLDALCQMLKTSSPPDDPCCQVQWMQDLNRRVDLASGVHSLPRHEQKALLLAHAARVEVMEACIDVTFTTNDINNTISTPATLARRGNELRLALPPEHAAAGNQSIDQTLVRLVAQGFAAREYLLAGKYSDQVGAYDRKHLLRLARVSWLAPDIISTIVEGRHPIQLTARHLLRCSDTPMDWQHQRSFLGFC
jgi:DNA invertase Pin-like site-specific DNA recombinase